MNYSTSLRRACGFNCEHLSLNLHEWCWNPREKGRKPGWTTSTQSQRVKWRIEILWLFFKFEFLWRWEHIWNLVWAQNSFKLTYFKVWFLVMETNFKAETGIDHLESIALRQISKFYSNVNAVVTYSKPISIIQVPYHTSTLLLWVNVRDDGGGRNLCGENKWWITRLIFVLLCSQLVQLSPAGVKDPKRLQKNVLFSFHLYHESHVCMESSVTVWVRKIS